MNSNASAKMISNMLIRNLQSQHPIEKITATNIWPTFEFQKYGFLNMHYVQRKDVYPLS